MPSLQNCAQQSPYFRSLVGCSTLHMPRWPPGYSQGVAGHKLILLPEIVCCAILKQILTNLRVSL